MLCGTPGKLKLDIPGELTVRAEKVQVVNQKRMETSLSVDGTLNRSTHSTSQEVTLPTEAKGGKVVILGLDGADFDLLQPLIDSGDLPNLRRFQQQGAWGRLASTIPPISVPAWPSCFTGVNPGKHGVFGFGKFDPFSYQDVLCRSTDVQAPALWHLVGEAGQRSLVINVPLTFPPQPLEGVLIAGMFPSTQTHYIYPPALQEEIHRQVGRVMLEPSIRTLRRASPARQVELLQEVVDQQRQLLFYLMRTQPWDLCFIVFRTPDHLHHAFLGAAVEKIQVPYRLSGGPGETIRRHYQHLDAILGDIAEQASEATLMVISDHGVSLQPYTLCLNEWLEEQGFLKWLPLFSRSNLAGCLRARPLERWLQALRLQFLAPLFPPEALQRPARLPDLERFISARGGVQWPYTRAFTDPATFYALRLNVKGREGQGVVDPEGAYEELREDLIRRLKQLCNPYTEEPMIECVHRREEIYQGPFAELAPDLLMTTVKDRYRVKAKRFFGSMVQATPLASWGQHSRHGILLMAGSAVARAELGLAQIVDVAPTALYLLGHAIPAHLDGRVLTKAVKPNLLDERPVCLGPPKEQRTPSPPAEGCEEEAEILEHLRDLGYID